MQNIPSFTKWLGFNSIICKYLYIFPKNTWAELHFFLITYMPQYIILAPTSCTCKTQLSDEVCMRRWQWIGRLLQEEQFKWHKNQTWANVIQSYFPLQFFRFVAAKELSDMRPKSYKWLTFYTIFRDKAVPLHSVELLLCKVPLRLKLGWFEGYILHRLQNSNFIF